MKISILLTIASLIHFSLSDQNERKNFRLINSVFPTSYSIELSIYLLEEAGKEFTFDGYVEITVRATEKHVKEVIFYQEGLNFHNVTLKRKFSDEVIAIESQHYDEETHKMGLLFNSELELEVDYVVAINYTRKISSESNGFYRIIYEDSNRTTNYFAVTKLQPSAARKVFPCFDEPKFKAVFALKISRNNKYRSYFNTKLLSTIPISSTRSLDVFNATPRMSTHTLAIAITDFEQRYVSENLTILTRYKDSSRTEFALEIAPKILRELEEFTDLTYRSVEGINKLDMIAVPEFASGAMENWGLVTFNENMLLSDQGRLAESKQRIATIVTHKLSHMWFGNLVTCDWWSYTWLNEAFAQYLEFYITDKVFPELELMAAFPFTAMFTALNADFASENVRPLTDRSVENVKDSKEMFSPQITYRKGASLLHMINHILQPETFRRALRMYLRTNEFKTATPDIFANAFTEVWDPSYEITFLDFLKDWTEKVGYPLVTFNISEDGLKVDIQQREFFATKSESDNCTRYNNWSIPIAYATDQDLNFSETSAKLFLKNNGLSHRVVFYEPINWLVGNIQRSGYYRVNYNIENWNKIGAALKQSNFGQIHAMNRAQLVDDILTLASGNYLEWELVFKFLEFLENETEYNTWLIFFNHLNKILNNLDEPSRTIRYKRVKNSFTSLYNRIQHGNRYDVVNSYDRKFREQIEIWGCKIGLANCTDDIMSDNYVNNSSHADVRKICWKYERYFARMWNTTFKKFKESRNEEGLLALACTRNEEQLEQLYSFIIREMDSNLLQYFAQTPNLGYSFDFLIAHKTDLLNNSSQSNYRENVWFLSSHVDTDEKLEKFKRIAEIYLDPGTQFEIAVDTAVKNLKEENDRYNANPSLINR